MTAELAAALAGLTPREEQILRLRMGGVTLVEVAKRFAVTRERIRTIQIKAVERLAARATPEMADVVREAIRSHHVSAGRRSKTLGIPMTPAQAEEIQLSAAQQGQSVGAYLRGRLGLP